MRSLHKYYLKIFYNTVIALTLFPACGRPPNFLEKIQADSLLISSEIEYSFLLEYSYSGYFVSLLRSHYSDTLRGAAEDGDAFQFNADDLAFF